MVSRNALRALAICVVFFASGAAGLVLETLWFHQARLVVGSSVIASALVPAAFMAGLGLGNAIALWRGERIQRTLQVYAALEVVVGLSGWAVVHLLPQLAPTLAPLFRALEGAPRALTVTRFAIVFAVLVLPSTAMGLTLPLLVRTLSATDDNFGRVLGRLYGWNTLGAVAGALATEAFLLGALGIRGSALVAAGLDVLAALVAWGVARGTPLPAITAASASAHRGERSLTRRLLAIAFVSGACLLALEVVWIRFLTLYVEAVSLAFALMLAIVLTGIGLGGLAGSQWLRLDPRAARFLAPVALTAGCLTVVTYAAFPLVNVSGLTRHARDIVVLAMPLLFPVSFASGALFALVGAALREARGGDASAAALLTLANTIGAAIGGLLGGLVLLPSIGMERSIFAIALAYGATALLGAPGLKTTARKVTVGLAAAFALSAVFFPFGKMERVHFAAPLKRWSPDPDSPVVVREGASETILYIERRFAERTRSHRMVTNGVSMSASDFRNRRYMKLFVYWPIALHPAPRKALLVCFGVGATAKALTDTRELETIDVVDVSKDVLEMRTIVHRDPAEDPLRDPRVRVHVEDGRFFLQTTSETFDLVTGEPPPPNLDGVEALYSLEYFRLVRDRLRPGGISTYWLPTHSLAENNARAVTRAFCDVFEDCSLWAGFGTDLILVGSRGASGPESEARFVAQWEDARVNTELTALGIEAPEQLGALMLADAEELRRLTASDLPTVDDFPRRITPPTFFASYATSGNGLYALWTDSDARRARFERSDFIKKRWPAAVRERTLDQFAAQAIFDRFAYRGSISLEDNLPSVHELLETTKREAPVLWMLGSDPDVQRIIDGLDPTERQRPDVAYHVACKAISERRFAAAIAPLERAEADAARRFSAVALRAYVLARIDRRDEAKTALAEARQRAAGSDKAAKLVTWLGGILEPKGAD